MSRIFLASALVLAASAAHADGAVGVVVTGDPSLQPAISAEVNAWLEQHGHRVDSSALSSGAVNKLIDCFVLDDTTCARAIVERDARTDGVVFARIESAGRDVTISATWVGKSRKPATQKTQCKACSEDALRITADAMLATLATASASAPAVATAPAPAAPAMSGAAAGAAPAASVTASTEPETAAPHGLAAGIEAGEPTSATIGWFAGAVSVTGALGTGTHAGPGVSAHVDVQITAAHFAPAIALRVGLGARYYHHGYTPASRDEIPDSHYGVRAPIAIALEKRSMELYAEVAPGLDFKRTTSCTLADGPDSICPHAQESPFFVQLVIGARFFFSP